MRPALPIKFVAALFVVILAVCAVAALAQEPFPQAPPAETLPRQQDPSQPAPQSGAENDPPSRAARLSFLSGTVSFQPGSVEDWVPATLNRPMTTGDRLWVEGGGRAEMHIGSAALRLNGRSNFAFLNLDDRTAQIQLSLGTMNVRVRRLAEDENFEIDTPQLALSVLRPGEYRVEVNEAGDTTVIGVRGGEAEATSAGQAFAIKARDQVRVTGTDQPTFDRRDIPPADAFDNWSADRDRREDMSESGRHVSRDVPGYGDLDSSGTWRNTPDNGWVWAPTVDPGWAPYHYGHWAWIAPWGWTWVDDAPWGYAPFHYGRWAFIGGAWVWVPGPVVVGVRPVYAPAMVAWVGGGGFGVGIGVGVAAVGWFPLGPREVWVPAYAASPAYFSRVNVSNTVVNNVTINNVYVNRTNVTYVNRNVNGAVAAMPQSALTRGQPVQANGIAVPRGAVERAQISATPAVAPQREAVFGGGRITPAAAPPAAVMNRQVVARNVPPPAPVPFAQQQAALQRNPGQPLPQSTVRQMQQNSPAPRAAVRQVGPVGGQTGGSFAGRPAGGPSTPASNPGGPATISRGQAGGQPGGGQPAGGGGAQPATRPFSTPSATPPSTAPQAQARSASTPASAGSARTSSTGTASPSRSGPANSKQKQKGKQEKPAKRENDR